MLKLNFKKTKLILLAFSLIFVVNILGINIKADTIKNYDIKMDVKTNGEIDVKQKIKIDFDIQRHGIYANIPQVYKMKWDENNTRYYFFPVTDVKVDKYNYEVDNEIEGISIKIGDADIYLDEGIHEFNYEYTIKTTDLKLDNKQMLYFNIVGNKWEHDIEKINFEINMPKEFSTKPEFYSDATSKYKIENNKIIGQSTSVLDSNSAFTMKLDLDDGYFDYNSSNAHAMTFLIISLGVLAIAVVLFFRYGKDDKIARSVEFKAPDNLSSAQVGYIIDRSISRKELTSLLIYWASKGYLIIREVDKKTFEIEKVKDISNTEMSYEQGLFDSLFKKKNIVKTDDMPEGYFEVLQSAQSDYSDYYKEDNELYDKKASRIKGILFAIVCLLVGLNIGLYTYSFTESLLFSAIIFVIPLLLYLLINIYIFSVINNLYIQKTFTKVRQIVVSLVLLLIFGALYYMIATFLGMNNMLIIGFLLAVFVVIPFLGYMPKRNSKGQRLVEQILGLRDFIESAEKDRLEMFVAENPSYFYDILPYAYVLNVSDKWIKNFENIQMEQPSWYYSSNSMFSTYLFMSTFNYTMSSLSAANTIPSAEGGSGGFSGGGGGFSGGGFGGGGGGSW